VKRATSFRQVLDLYHAFSLLIMNKVLNADPHWAQWDRETEAAQYDRAVADNTNIVRLTFELRKQWTPPAVVRTQDA